MYFFIVWIVHFSSDQFQYLLCLERLIIMLLIFLCSYVIYSPNGGEMGKVLWLIATFGTTLWPTRAELSPFKETWQMGACPGARWCACLGAYPKWPQKSKLDCNAFHLPPLGPLCDNPELSYLYAPFAHLRCTCVRMCTNKNANNQNYIAIPFICHLWEHSVTT